MTVEQQEELNNLKGLLESGAISQTEYDELVFILNEKKQESIEPISNQNLFEYKNKNPLQFERDNFNRTSKKDEEIISEPEDPNNKISLKKNFQSSIIKVFLNILLIPVAYVSQETCTNKYSNIITPSLLFEKWAAGITVTLFIATIIYTVKKLFKQESCFVKVFYQCCFYISFINLIVYPASYVIGLFYGCYFK